MTQNQTHTEIISIVDKFGITGKKASEIMGMGYSMFRNRKNKVKYYYFTEEHLEKLKKHFNL